MTRDLSKPAGREHASGPGPDIGRMGECLALLAHEVRAGDFTTSTGYRHVVSVEHIYVTAGRGKKKATLLTEVLLHRALGPEPDSFAPDEGVRVYRRPGPRIEPTRTDRKPA
jgi:hypothetical protein